MPDVNDSGDKPLEPQPYRALNTPDANMARNASGQDIQAVEARRINASDGSATPRNLSLVVADSVEIERQKQIQNESLAICDDEVGVVVSRTQKGTEKDFKRQSQSNTLSGTMPERSEGAKTDPAMEVANGFRDWAKNLPLGDDRAKFVEIARLQAKELKSQCEISPPEADQDSCGAHQYQPATKAISIGGKTYSANDVLAYDSGAKEQSIVAQNWSVDYSIERAKQYSVKESHRIHDGHNATNNAEFLDMFLAGSGNDKQVHDVRGDEMLEAFIKSPGAQSIREQYAKSHFSPFTDKLGYGTIQAFQDTMLPKVDASGIKIPDYTNPGVHVGGFGNPPKQYQPWAACTGTRCDEGGKPSKDGDHVQFQVVNIAGAKSWFYHSKFIEDKPMGEKGEFRNIVEIFKWIEPLPNLKRSP